VLVEQRDEWTEMRRYIGLDVLAKSRQTILQNTEPEEVTLTAITAEISTQDHAAPSSRTTPRDVSRVRSPSGDFVRSR
jgi:hypothetical protein